MCVGEHVYGSVLVEDWTLRLPTCACEWQQRTECLITNFEVGDLEVDLATSKEFGPKGLKRAPDLLDEDCIGFELPFHPVDLRGCT